MKDDDCKSVETLKMKMKREAVEQAERDIDVLKGWIKIAQLSKGMTKLMF